MKLIKTTLVISALIFSTSGMAIDKTAAGAVAGAAIGAATGKDLKSTVGGASWAQAPVPCSKMAAKVKPRVRAAR